MDVAELTRQIEEKVAPEPLIAVQGLANTIASTDTVERLADSASAREWLLASDLATPSVEVDADALANLRELREVVRALMDANHDAEADPAAGAHLARLAAEHPIELGAGADGRLAVDMTPPDTVDAVIGQMVGIVFQAQLESQWERMKICAADECRWAFYDRSRNRGGNWCSMEGCGNRAKNRSFRARQAR
jgi:predicted RNA-binding Zn ribbon-like protein